jgi:hypothetical protein
MLVLCAEFSCVTCQCCIISRHSIEKYPKHIDDLVVSKAIKLDQTILIQPSTIHPKWIVDMFAYLDMIAFLVVILVSVIPLFHLLGSLEERWHRSLLWHMLLESWLITWEMRHKLGAFSSLAKQHFGLGLRWVVIPLRQDWWYNQRSWFLGDVLLHKINRENKRGLFKITVCAWLRRWNDSWLRRWGS